MFHITWEDITHTSAVSEGIKDIFRSSYTIDITNWWCFRWHLRNTVDSSLFIWQISLWDARPVPPFSELSGHLDCCGGVQCFILSHFHMWPKDVRPQPCSCSNTHWTTARTNIQLLYIWYGEMMFTIISQQLVSSSSIISPSPFFSKARISTIFHIHAFLLLLVDKLTAAATIGRGKKLKRR